MIELIEGYTPQHYKVVQYMRSEVFIYYDEDTEEVSIYDLAQDAARKFALLRPPGNNTYPEWLFELAYEVVAEYEEKERG